MKLALLASLAARLEPELLRKLRLELLPEAGADAEADFWFSDAVEARSTSWLVLVPEKAEALRERCAVELSEDERQRARGIIAQAHALASPLVQLEDELHWHTMRRDNAAIDAILKSMVEALRGNDAIAVARWALRTLPRLSSWVRQLPTAWVVRLVAEQQLGHALRIEPGTSNIPPEVWPLLRGALTPTELWVRLTAKPRHVELSREPLLGGNSIIVPLTEPLIVDVEQQPVTVPRTGIARVPVGSRWVHLQTLDGARHALVPSGKPQNFVTFRFLLISGMRAADGEPGRVEDRIVKQLKKRPVDAIFVAGDLTARGSEQQFLAAAKRIERLQHAGGNEAHVLLVPGSDEPVLPYLAMATRFDTPPVHRGGNPDAFAATLIHQGASIGIAGFQSFERYTELENLVGRDINGWFRAHHVTILLTATTPSNEELPAPFDIHLTGSRSSPIKERLIIAPPLTPPLLAIEPGFVVGELRIGSQNVLSTAVGREKSEAMRETMILLPTHQPVRRAAVAPRQWILVAGSARKLSTKAQQTARALGAALATAGYGLSTGGWRGIDEEVTAGYAAAYLGAPDTLHDAIRHYVGRVEPQASLPGRRIFFDADHRAVSRSVADVKAVVLIGGIGGTEWIGEEAMRQERRLLPIAATGGAAKKMAYRLPVESPLRDEEATPQQLAVYTVEAIRNPDVTTSSHFPKPAVLKVPMKKRPVVKSSSSSSKSSSRRRKFKLK
jgi:hypothetical protein